MSYYIFITRQNIFESDPNPDQITYEEWSRVAEADPEFEVDDYGGGRKDFCWKAHPDRPLFEFFDSMGVGVRMRDMAICRKMFEIAGKLFAVVMGESSERYRLTDRGVEQYWEDPSDGPPTIVIPLDE